jgi:mycofactocin precursor
MRKETNVEKVETQHAEEIRDEALVQEPTTEEPHVLDEICVEELAIDGICGVY